jgi:hypothetical protein
LRGSIWTNATLSVGTQIDASDLTGAVNFPLQPYQLGHVGASNTFKYTDGTTYYWNFDSKTWQSTFFDY